MPQSQGTLSPQSRTDALQRMRDEVFDVAIVGGGVVGSGAALDAVSRGLSVALVEARDLASGTSSRSSKLIHGGLRYLEQLDFALVREALRERSLLLDRLAPHLVRPLPFLALLRHRGWERAYVGAGLVLYDTMGATFGRGRGVPAQRHYTRRQTLKKFPALRKEAFTGAIQYYDAQVDDARHTMFLARTAAAYGAQVATRAQAVGFLREGEHVTGVKVVDLEAGGEPFALRARQTINATGVWTDDTQDMVGARGQFHVRASKGVHLLVPRDRIHGDTALTIRTETSVLFVIPWGRHWIIGTTDTDWELDKAHPAASKKDIDYLLDEVNHYLVTPLGHDDVEGVYAGLRPLLAGESEGTSALSREHVVAHPVPGLVAVAGGKYTTYRVMAEDAVDAAVHGLEATDVPESVTDRLPLLGAEGYIARWNGRRLIAERSGVHLARIEHLLHRYGSLIDELLAMIEAEPELGRPLEGADDYLAVEIRYAATHEGAAHLEDVLTRRTRISIETWDRGLRAAEPAARLMAGPLGWDEDRVRREVEHYRARVQAERQSQEQDDDLGADSARIGAPDIAPTLPVERKPTSKPPADAAPVGEQQHAGEPVTPRG